MMKIIDNKKINITNDEYSMYVKIARSYDRQNFNGEDLFRDHFETDDNGIIIFVKPPHDKYTSMEVYCFLISLMVNQHIRIMREQVDALVKEAENKINSLIKEISDLKNTVEQLTDKPLKTRRKKTKDC